MSASTNGKARAIEVLIVAGHILGNLGAIALAWIAVNHFYPIGMDTGAVGGVLTGVVVLVTFITVQSVRYIATGKFIL